MASTKKFPARKVRSDKNVFKKWTNERVQEEADYLLNWAAQKDSIVLATCYGERKYHHDDVAEWCGRHEGYKLAQKLAMTIVGARREKMAMLGLLDNSIVKATLGVYDPIYKAFFKEMKKCDRENEESEVVRNFIKTVQDGIKRNPVKD